MIKEPLFNIISIDHTESTINAVLAIDQSNEIFTGHFPDQPVVPGACMLQVVKGILEKSLAKSLRLIKADNIKFLSLVEPAANNQLQLNISYQFIDNDIKITANLFAGEVVCMKMQGVLIVI